MRGRGSRCCGARQTLGIVFREGLVANGDNGREGKLACTMKMLTNIKYRGGVGDIPGVGTDVSRHTGR